MDKKTILTEQKPADRRVVARLIGLLLVCVFQTSCSLVSAIPGVVPGIRLKPPSTWFPAGPGERTFPEPEVVPITATVVAQNLPARNVEAPTGPGTKLPGPEAYGVGPGDILSIIVFDHPELNNPLSAIGASNQGLGGDRSITAGGSGGGIGSIVGAEQSAWIVREDGTLFYPYVGVMQVNGKTTEQIRAILSAELARVVAYPQVAVRVLRYRSQRVFVNGEVRTPGVQAINDQSLTLLDALNNAGGLTEAADKQAALLTHDGVTRRVDLLALYESGRGNVLLRHGDVLYVPDTQFNAVFVMGEVVQQTTVPLNKGRLSLAEALTAARGLALATADTKSIYVIRAKLERDQTGAEQIVIPRVYHLDARAAPALLLAEQFPLQPRDVVFVAAPGLVHWNRALNQIFPTIASIFAGVRIAE